MDPSFRYSAAQQPQPMAPPTAIGSPYQGYRGVGTPTMASPLQRTSPMSPHMARLPGSPPMQNMRHSGQRSMQSSPKLMQIGPPQSAVGRSAYSMSPPPAVSATPPPPRLLQHPTNQHLPSRAVNRENIEDAYIAFVLYCNPNIPASANTSNLRRVFSIPPKSDGKVFSTHKLWELIRRMDQGELGTWAHLATSLGVDPPTESQSSQKVQQYAVRLKKWMHAMHIDAFFEYLLGKDHVYYQRIPTDSVYVARPRDGVPPAEDLVIKTLLPEWKPKRGRKNASEREDNAQEQRPAKRAHIEIPPSMLEYQGLESASMFPQGEMTWSAFPDDPESQDPWANAGLAISNAPPQNGQTSMNVAGQRWQRGTSPIVYPQSAIEPTYNIDNEFDDVPEPRSAIAPNSSTKTTRGWKALKSLSSQAASRSSSVRPSHDSNPFAALNANQNLRSTVRRAPQGKPPSRPPSVAASAKSIQLHAPIPQVSRPAKLQLQVPHHLGGPIRLATPPNPAVMINGASNMLPSSGRGSADFFRTPDGAETLPDTNAEDDNHEPPSPFDLTISDVIHAFASRILHGRLTGRPAGTLAVEEATLMATKIVEQLRHDFPPELSQSALAIRCATALGVSADLGIGSGSAGIVNVKAIPQTVDGMRNRAGSRRRRSDREGVEYIINFEIVFGNGISSSVQIHNIYVPLHMNSEQAEREIERLREIIFHGNDNDDDDDDHHHLGGRMTRPENNNRGLDDEEKVWRDKYFDLLKEVKRKDEALRRLKRRVFEVVMASPPHGATD